MHFSIMTANQTDFWFMGTKALKVGCTLNTNFKMIPHSHAKILRLQA